MTVTTSPGAGSHALPPASQHQPAAPILEPVRPRRATTARVAVVLVTTLALLSLVGGFALANLPRTEANVLAAYAAADTTAYVELRLDLPGDQRERVAQLVGQFPGFDDAATIEGRIGEAFDELADKADADFRWSRDVEPWFGGQLALMVTIDSDEAQPDEPPFVIGISVKDAAAARELIVGRLTGENVTFDEYRGATVWHRPAGDRKGALALTNDALLLGRSVDEVHAALDVAAGERPALPDNAAYAEPVAALHEDRLATVYVDGAALADLYADRSSLLTLSLQQPYDMFSGVLVAELRAEGDHLALTARSRPAAGSPPLPANRTTSLAQRMPVDSVAYLEVRAAGESLERAIAAYLAQLADEDPDDGGMLPQLETLLGTPPDEFLDFLDDAAVAVTADDDSFSGGLVATLKDEQVARERLQRLVGVIRTWAAFETAPLTVSEEQYGGETLVVIKPTVRSGSMPGLGSVLPALSFTFTDGLLVLGMDDFVRGVLDADPAAGLASNEGYRAALAAAGADNAGVGYVDLAVLRGHLEGMIGRRDRAAYDRDLQPYLAPFDRLMVVTVVEGGELVSRTLVYVE